MIKFISILNEIILESNIIQIPKTELDKADKVYNYIQKNFDKISKQTEGRDSDHSLTSAKLKKYFNLTDYKGNQRNISVGFYNDPDDYSSGKMYSGPDFLLININNFKNLDLIEFKELIEHELIHSIDPKTNDADIHNKLSNKKAKIPQSGVSDEEHNRIVYKYLKSPWEFDAFTAPLINRIKNNINKSEDPNHLKELLNQFFSDLRNKEPEELILEPKYKIIPWLFTTVDWSSNNINKVDTDYIQEMDKIKVWLSKPTLYTRFLKRLFRNI